MRYNEQVYESRLIIDYFCIKILQEEINNATSEHDRNSFIDRLVLSFFKKDIIN